MVARIRLIGKFSSYQLLTFLVEGIYYLVMILFLRNTLSCQGTESDAIIIQYVSTDPNILNHHFQAMLLVLFKGCWFFVVTVTNCSQLYQRQTMLVSQKKSKTVDQIRNSNMYTVPGSAYNFYNCNTLDILVYRQLNWNL